ncbi:MAG: hypothetical protein ACOCRO_02030, partial [Halanaerobiales bacterium]
KARMAQTIGIVKKRLANKHEDDIFDLDFSKNKYGFNSREANEMEDEPHYVKHMKSIEFARKKGSSFGRSKLKRGRSYSGSNMGRKNF